jgi:hypothetical protein
MSSVRSRRLAVLLLATIAAVVMVAPPALAASITFTDLTQPGFLIGKAVRKAVFGIDMRDASNTATFDGLSVELADVGGDGDFDLTNLDDLQAAPDGVAVYRDDGTVADKLDANDTRVSDGWMNTNGSLDVTVDSDIPAAAEGLYTYFLAVETSSGIGEDDDFTVAIPTAPLFGCSFETTPATGGFLGDPCPAGDTTETITAETTAPTASLTTTPATATGNVVWTFSEEVVGVTEDNVVLQEEGVPGNLDAMVTPSPTTPTVTATIDPDVPLAPGATYESFVNPDGALSLVTDEAGNPVAETPESFTMADFGFTPGVLKGNKWFLNNAFDSSNDIPAFAYGGASDFPLVGDWDNDGIFTPGVRKGNVWFLNNDFDASNDIPAFAYGSASDFPVAGDWDEDGFWTIGVVKGNVWFLNNDLDSSNDIPAFAYGSASDLPVVGDWNGDGTTTPGVVKGNVWFLNNAFDPSNDIPAFGYGSVIDFPVVGDWDGDLMTTPGVVKGNVWFLNNGFDSGHDVPAFAYGSASDFPVAGDWDASIGP